MGKAATAEPSQKPQCQMRCRHFQLPGPRPWDLPIVPGSCPSQPTCKSPKLTRCDSHTNDPNCLGHITIRTCFWKILLSAGLEKRGVRVWRAHKLLKKLHGLFKVNTKIYPLYLGDFFFHSVYMAFQIDAKKIRLSDCFRETHTHWPCMGRHIPILDPDQKSDFLLCFQC